MKKIKNLIFYILLITTAAFPATPYMALTLPTVSSTPGPTWATMLNTAFTSVDAHDHTTGKGTQVPTAGININADLDFNSYNATGLKTATVDNQSAALSASFTNAYYAVSGAPYFNTSSGTATQLVGLTVPFVAGDILYASSTTAISRLSIGSSGKPLIVSSGLPAWATLAETGGGTNQTTYTTGDILYASASNTLSKLAVGSTGQFLKVAGGVPTWSTGAATSAVSTKSANYTLTISDDVILCSASLTLSFPTAASSTGKIWKIKNIGSSATVTLNTYIDGTSGRTIKTQYEWVSIVSDGTSFYFI